MNINNLQIQLQTAIENTTNTTYYLQLAKAIQALNMGQIRTVATFANLPSAATQEGWLIFVEADERLYVSDGTEWATIVPFVNQAWAWGANNFFDFIPFGQLGDNTTVNKSSPVSVVGGFCDWCQVSAGASFSLGVRTRGTAWAWGYNNRGQLGTNNTISMSSPVSVVGGFADWCQVSAGSDHSLGVRQNGTAWAWGTNYQGRLGDNTATNKSSPVSVVGGFCDWCQVSAGYHSLGVRQSGTAWAWGRGTEGQLGDNTTVDRSSPVSVVGGFTDWCQVSASVAHSLGVRQNGTAWGWGSNVKGQLGNNTVTDRSSPVSVVGGFTNWCQVAAGSANSLAVRQNGTAWSWGCNSNGELGDNTTASKSSPVSVVGGFTDWCQVSTSNSPLSHSLGVRQNGTAWAWGCNFCGQLGDNTETPRSSPVSVIGGFTDWCQVSAGWCHSLAIRSSPE
jgi:alpha-tubulin suppressor-like RCC1 family protein